MAMDLCTDEKDEERESEAQSDVRAKKRAGAEGGEEAGGGARFFALTVDCAPLSRSSSFSSVQRSIAISLSMFCVVIVQMFTSRPNCGTFSIHSELF